MFCKNCGKQIDDKAVVCPCCGVETKRYGNANDKQPVINIVNENKNVNGICCPRKSKWTAFFLCLFLGFLGVHRFYVGKSGTGIIYLCTAGIFGVGCVVDLVLILLGGFRDKFGQPLV